VTLGVEPGVAPSPKPPVRIFLGSEAAQQRAERVFCWSIEQVRDPARVYEIHLLRDLSGFRSRRWTTGFTNHRFAVPHFAGSAGRAIYNDVDQVYLVDPAELFDAEMGECGYLAISREDTSVMLLDCARMHAPWTLRAAQREPKARLTRRAARTPGLFGQLAPEWNARDGEYAEGRSKCLHFTTLATQPWRPFPERFVYGENPAARVFFGLERAADARCYQIFTRARPSAGFAAWLAGRPADAGCDPALPERWDVADVEAFDPGGCPSRPPAEGVATCRVLDDAPADDLPWLLDELAARAHAFVHVAVACDGAQHSLRSMGVPSERPRTPEWWQQRIEAAAARHPQLHWQLALQLPDGRRELREAGEHIASRPPRVWVLSDDRPGCRSQSTGVAEVLGWPTAVKQLRYAPAAMLHNRLLGASRLGVNRSRSSPLEPPWPDLVIAAGRRSAPVAEWIRAQNSGATRLVVLGRKAGDAAERYDLSLAPRYARLFPHPKRVATVVPPHVVNEERLAEAAHRWKERLAALKSPRIAVLVGGSSGQYQLAPPTARRLGEDVARMAQETGGSIMATTSRRTGDAAAAAIRSALDADSFVHVWGDGADNPFVGLLALADAFVVTGDSESMLAEALGVGRPVHIYPLPTRASFAALRIPRDRVCARAHTRSPGRRGSPRPQKGLSYLAARLIDRGFVRPARDLDVLHADLIARGLALPFGDPFIPGERRPVSEVGAIAARVRALMGVEGRLSGS